MGGNAFNAVVNFSGIFPRMQPALYRCLRQKHEDALKKLYTLVGTPAEAPEKVDHGDVDFIVWHPCPVDHLSVQEALKASHVKPMDGPRTSNYAVPLDAQDEYCQVDVHVCATEGEWQRTMFFHSYGDMGMILGLIARGVGLHLGVHGLRYPIPKLPPWHLSSNFDDILPFFGWSKSRFDRGFKTKVELFEWIWTTEHIHPRTFGSNNAVGKVDKQRKLYHEFVAWGRERQEQQTSESPQPRATELQVIMREKALQHFGVQAEVEAFIHAESSRARWKALFNGHLVEEWTEIPLSNWKRIKQLMDTVRQQLDGEAGGLDQGPAYVLKMFENDDGALEFLKAKSRQVVKELED
ncbi:hypothetical protein CYLTODRAFT_112399 [Cylindrobasidium torrendii FP15055 ss-10]|uniref:Uncharacterized protein n=1 Tax=Cylindrobasidium torrendii FP15055 ss-10 TaxID=1314674 RepID=A0A0D7B0I3_9AGAR|nr:hypothetical protein CYLTODRAFT_112399 [Cylindrobasidium torrendii FP15055 ss-10]